MDFKKIMLITFMLLAVLTISAVSASDNLTDADDEVLADASSDEIELSDDVVSSAPDEIIKETNNGTFTALQDKINGVEEGSIVELETDYTYDGGFDSDGVKISKSLTIDGKGYTIDAKSQGRAFNIRADNVVLKNIIFTNGQYENDFGGGQSIIMVLISG